jgi:hypothetical protein
VYGTKQFTGVGYPTPVSIPEDTSCLILQIPADADWWGVVVGLLYSLILEWNWQQFEGGLDRDVVAARWQQMLEDALDVAEASNDCALAVRAPYWDDGSDVGIESDVATQPWYGYVTDVDSPETTFVEDVAIWAFTGALALAGASGAAIAFNTLAPKFVVAIRRGALSEVIKLYVDGIPTTVDTSAYAEGEIIEQVVAGDAELENHQLYVVKVS